MVVVSLVLSAGFNLYQRYQYNDLLTRHTTLEGRRRTWKSTSC